MAGVPKDSTFVPAAWLPLPTLGAAYQDNFGYQITEQTYSWLEAPSGTAELSFSTPDDGFVSIDLPFSFAFYENTYSQAFVSTNGLITFDTESTSFNNQPIPRLPQPNNFVAAFWDDLAVGGGYNAGKVFAFSSGENFVIEWREVTRSGNTENLLTFEAILSRDGTICLQYQSLVGDLTSATIGIEDGDGIDGLEFLYNSTSPDLSQWIGKKALCFKRPAASGRAKLLPPYQSGFTTRGQIDFSVQLKNIGELGQDVYNLAAQSSNSAWEVTFWDQNGQTPLADHEGDGNPDLTLAQGETYTFVVRAAAPDDQAGYYTQIELSATSTKSPPQSASALLQAAVPARFVQFLADDKRGLNVHWITESSAPESEIEPNFTGSAMAMGEGISALYPLVWEVNGEGYAQLAYQWLAGGGSRLFSTRFVGEHAVGSLIFDREPSVGQSEDGIVAFVWIRNTTTQQGNTSNVFFLRLDRQGRPLGELLDLTHQPPTAYTDLISYSAPRLAVLENPTRWLLVWQATQQGMSEIQSALVNSDGSIGQSPQTLLAADAQNQYQLPALLASDDNQALLFYTQSSIATNVLQGSLFNLSTSSLSLPFELGHGWMGDGIELENGDVIVAWTDEEDEQTQARLLKRTAQGFEPFGSSTVELPTPYELRHSENVSITRVGSDTVVVTWKDADEEDYLYYALLKVDETQASGLKVLTPPMIFYTAEDGLKVIISAGGQGNAPYPPARLFLPLILRQ